MQIDCPKCKSSNTYMVKKGSILGQLLGKIGIRLPVAGHGLPMGQFYIICRDCGFKTVIFIN
ncbi:MAG: hypothetical protein LBP95_06475 [Deltaproteobacteria bacterium]|nr:hypothetical protein [Deltaproteobacteria bacterium]